MSTRISNSRRARCRARADPGLMASGEDVLADPDPGESYVEKIEVEWRANETITSSACSGLIRTQVMCLSSPDRGREWGGATDCHASSVRPRRRTQCTCPDD